MRKLAFCCAAVCTVAAVAGDKLTPVATDEIGFVRPVRAAKIDIHGNILSEWKDLQVNTRQSCTTFAFDAYDGDPITLDLLGGDLCGLPGPGYRWFLRWSDGNKYKNTQWHHDMNDILARAVGGRSQRAGVVWGNGPTFNKPIFGMAIFTSDENEQCVFPETFYDGIIFEFDGGTNGGNLKDRFWRSDLDVCGDPDLFWQMPATAHGSFLVQYVQADRSGGPYEVTDAQPMLWGTAEHGGTPGRQGTSDLAQQDDGTSDQTEDCPTADVNQPDGVIYPPCECFDYTFGVCPDPLMGMMGFLVEDQGGGCLELGDCDGDGDIDLSDLATLLSCYNAGTCCDTDGDGNTGLSDLAQLLAHFNQQCP